MDRDKLMKMASAVRTGGKGSVRRKKKAQHKTTSTDDKRLQSTLKRLGVNTIPGIEEVNIVKDDSIIHFVNPKVQASIAANTYVVSGPSTTKSLADMPDIMSGFNPAMLSQMDPASLAQLQKMAAQYQAAGGQLPGMGGAEAGEDDDDDVPDLVENFEEASK
jgi:nascent polypeptide-associated complex subunit beta